jgi:hypothetical protein
MQAFILLKKSLSRCNCIFKHRGYLIGNFQQNMVSVVVAFRDSIFQLLQINIPFRRFHPEELTFPKQGSGVHFTHILPSMENNQSIVCTTSIIGLGKKKL